MKRLKQSPFVKQAGFASFAVTLVLMIVISLIVLGFAANSRLEQRRSVDNQLSTEAYDAAESGINTAYTLIEKGINQTPYAPPQDQTTCNSGPYSLSQLDSGGNVEVSCLLVNVTPPDWQGVLPVSKSEVVPLESSSIPPSPPPSIDKIQISWQGEDQTPPIAWPQCPATDSFPAESAWPSKCRASVMQIDIVPARGWTAANVNSYTQTFYLYPSNGGASTYALNTANTNGAVIATHCNNGNKPYACQITLTNMLTAPGSSDAYYLRLTPWYLVSDSVDIVAQHVGSLNNLNLANSQAVIDSTGRAQDVLKRIQERVCINNVCNSNPSASGGPVGAIESTNGICKRYEVSPGFYQQDAGGGNSCSTNPFP